MRRREFIGLAGAATILAGHSELRAELHTRKHRIGFLGPTTLVEYADRVEALREGLRRLGYVEGENFTIDQRWAEGKYERLPDLAAELVRSDVELILTWGTPATRAALAATTKIPLVTIVVADLLSTGLIQSLARPGGNLTGQTFFFAEVCAKRVELIKEVMPALERVAILANPANPSHAEALAAMKATAQGLRLELLPVEASNRADLGRTFEVMNKEGTQALVVIDDAFLTSNAAYITDLAAKARTPTIGEKAYATTGGLMSYGADMHELWFQSATFVDRILKGTHPADLPVQQATKFKLVINLNTAKTLNLMIPPTFLARADEVIE